MLLIPQRRSEQERNGSFFFFASPFPHLMEEIMESPIFFHNEREKLIRSRRVLSVVCNVRSAETSPLPPKTNAFANNSLCLTHILITSFSLSPEGTDFFPPI